MEEIDHGIYYETAYSGVTLGALLLPHGTVLIDAPLRAEEGRAWRNALQSLGANSNRLLVNLDAHPDRTLGARGMDCTIIAHQKTAQVFRSRPSVFKGQNTESGSEWETYDEAVGTRWAVPDITFIQRIFLHWGPPDITLEQHPGPTPGAIWAIIPDSKVVFVGDAIVADQPAFLANADIAAWLETIDVLLASYKDYAIISGRGGPVPFKAVSAQQKHLKNVFKSLEKIARQHASLEATEKLIPRLLADFDIPDHLEEQYAQRLRHGLIQYFARHYRPTEFINHID